MRANQYGRIVALVGVGVLGLTLVWPSLAERLARPFVRLGGSLTQSPGTDSSPGIWRSVLLGVGTGLLWAPCAGPILGLVLTGAAVEGARARTVLLLLAYAAGASVSLAVALLAGGRLLAGLQRSLKAEAWVMMSSTSVGNLSGPQTLPELAANGWLNSEPLERNALQGHVVLIDFWTYSCINCLRTLP